MEGSREATVSHARHIRYLEAEGKLPRDDRTHLHHRPGHRRVRDRAPRQHPHHQRPLGVDREAARRRDGRGQGEGRVVDHGRDEASNLCDLSLDAIQTHVLRRVVRRALPRQALLAGRERVVVALDHREGEVMVRGWRDTTKMAVGEAVTKFLALGVKLYLITSITKDGTLTGPDSGVMTIARNYPEANILAAGGVRNLEDLIALKRIGVWGVVIGKALYEGVLDFKEATKFGKA